MLRYHQNVTNVPIYAFQTILITQHRERITFWSDVCL